MGLLPTTRISTASEPGGSECSVKVAAVTVSDTRPLDRFRPAAPLAVDSGYRPLSSRDFTSCRTLTRAATRDVYCHMRRLPPSSRFFYFCRAQSALHGDQCLQHGDQLRHVRAPCNFLRLVIFKLTLLIITRQKTTKSTASQRVCDPTASTRPSLACDVVRPPTRGCYPIVILLYQYVYYDFNYSLSPIPHIHLPPLPSWLNHFSRATTSGCKNCLTRGHTLLLPPYIKSSISPYVKLHSIIE